MAFINMQYYNSQRQQYEEEKSCGWKQYKINHDWDDKLTPKKVLYKIHKKLINEDTYPSIRKDHLQELLFINKYYYESQYELLYFL